MGRPCPYCKSPSWQNPCWYYLDHGDERGCGWDAPCVCDDYSRAESRRDAALERRIFLYPFLVVIAFAVTAYLFG